MTESEPSVQPKLLLVLEKGAWLRQKAPAPSPSCLFSTLSTPTTQILEVYMVKCT